LPEIAARAPELLSAWGIDAAAARASIVVLAVIRQGVRTEFGDVIRKALSP